MEIKINQKRAICNIHDDILSLCDDLYKIKIQDYHKFEDGIINHADFEYDMDRLISQIIRLTEDAKERGIAMEDRLTEYKDTIESLGFIRDKDNKIKIEIARMKEKIFELENIKVENNK